MKIVKLQVQTDQKVILELFLDVIASVVKWLTSNIHFLLDFVRQLILTTGSWNINPYSNDSEVEQTFQSYDYLLPHCALLQLQ